MLGLVCVVGIGVVVGVGIGGVSVAAVGVVILYICCWSVAQRRMPSVVEAS